MPCGVNRYDEAARQGRLRAQKYRYNLMLQSENLAASWSTVATTLAAAQGPAPDTAPAAGRVTDDATSSRHIAYQNITAPASTICTWSAFLRQSTLRYVQLQSVTGGGDGTAAVFDLQTGVI